MTSEQIKMFSILDEIDKERKENKGIKFDRIIKYYYPLFVEYGSMKIQSLIDYENRLKECNETKNVYLICTLSSSFEWHRLNFYRKANNIPSLEEVNEHDEKDYPFKINTI